MFIDYTIPGRHKKICGFSGLCMISPLMMMCAPTTMYGYPIVDGAHHNLLKHNENEFPPLGEG